MTIIGWPIEVGSRELDARLVFGLHCTERGLSFASGTKSSVTEAAVATKDFVYIHKSAASKQRPRFAGIVEAGNRIYVHDEEGLVTSRRDFEPRFDPICLDWTHGYFLYGKAQRETRRSLNTEFSRFSVVGHPTFDLLRGSLSALYMGAAHEYQELFGRYALLAPREASFVNQIEFATNLLKTAVIDTAVIKPHPGYRQAALPSLAEGFRVVPREERIGPLLLGSKLLLHYESTTAISASLVNVGAVDFSSHQEDTWVDQRLFGPRAAELEFFGGSAPLPAGHLVCPTETGDLMHSDTESASERIVNQIVADGAQALGQSRLGPRLRPWRPRKSLSSLSEHGRLKAGSIAPSEVHQRIEAMAAAFGTSPPRIRFYGDSLFLIHPN